MGMHDERPDVIERDAAAFLALVANRKETALHGKIQIVRCYVDHALHAEEPRARL